MKPVGTVGELRALLAQYYDGQPLTVECKDTAEEFQILCTDAVNGGEVIITIQ